MPYLSSLRQTYFGDIFNLFGLCYIYYGGYDDRKSYQNLRKIDS